MAIQIDPNFLAFTLIAYSTPLPLPPTNSIFLSFP